MSFSSSEDLSVTSQWERYGKVWDILELKGLPDLFATESVKGIGHTYMYFCLESRVVE